MIPPALLGSLLRRSPPPDQSSPSPLTRGPRVATPRPSLPAAGQSDTRCALRRYQIGSIYR
eukprot:scaffold4267_cov124-Isochrysis_galbana.AAC.9